MQLRIFIIRGCVDTSKFKPLVTKSSDAYTFLVAFIGRLTEEKGAGMLLDLCTIAVRKLPSVKFVILGDGHFKSKFSVLPNVAHIGQVNHDKLNDYLSCVNVVVSFQKTLGMGEVEALACGKPIIGSNVGEMPLLLSEGQVGLICEPRVSCYINAIRTLTTDDTLLKKLSTNSRLIAVDNFDIKSSSKKWNFVINRILSSSTQND
jgi:glycosyltransferase involved in cell wall biosynthesis